MRVALYIRVSTEEQAIHGLSIEAQTEALDEWAANQHVQVVDHYIDAGISARKAASKRPDLQRLLHDIRAGRIDVVVFTKLDRWFRSISEYYKVQEVLERHGVSWKTVHEDYDTSTASGRFKVNIMLSVAQDEADRTSERISIVFDSKKQRREPVSGNAPLGLLVKDKKLIHDPATAPIVQDLFQVYVASRSAYEAQRYMANAYGINYDTGTVRRLLRNRKYIGEAYGLEGWCDPLIDRDIFDLAQEILAERAQRHTHKAAGRIYLFKGLLTCQECHHALSGLTCKGIYYYRCSRHVEVGDCTRDAYIREDYIEQYMLSHILIECDAYNVRLNKTIKEKPPVDEVGIRRKMTKLKDLYLSDLIDRDEYEHDFNELRNALADCQKQSAPTPQCIDLGLVRAAVEAYASLDRLKKREFWSRSVYKIDVAADNSIYFTLRNTYQA